MFDVICIGNLNYDITFKTNQLPGLHEKIRCEDVVMGLGGAAGNTAYWLASLSHRVGFIGCVGNDVFGENHIAEFKKKKIDTSQVETLDLNTGVAFVFSKKNEKRIIKSTGANNSLTIDKEYLCKTRHVHLSSNKRETVEEVIEICRKNNISNSYDPGENQYLDLFSEVNYLILNEDEAKRATKSNDTDKAVSLLPARKVVVTKKQWRVHYQERR